MVMLATCGQSHLALAAVVGVTVTAESAFTGSTGLSLLLAQADNRLTSNIEINREADFFINSLKP